MLCKILQKSFIVGLLAVSSICFAGDRELVSCEPAPGLPNVIAYTKIHMDSIKLYTNINGQRILSFLKECHYASTVNSNKRVSSLLSVEVDIDQNLQRTTDIKSVNYELGETKYNNFSFGWLPVTNDNEEINYVARNYQRYKSYGTIGDKFRSYEEMLTENQAVKERFYGGPNGSFETMPAQDILARYQGKWVSPEGRVSIEINGDRVRSEDDKMFVSVEIRGNGTISKGYGNIQYKNPPEGYSYSVDNLFWIYWDNGSLSAEYFDGRGPHTRVKNRLIKVQ